MPSSKLYVGNLAYAVTSEQLQTLFATHGEVKSVNIIQGRGFGFVEMADADAAQKAAEALNGNDLQGRPLKISEARPPKKRFDNNRGRDDRGGGGYGNRY